MLEREIEMNCFAQYTRGNKLKTSRDINEKVFQIS